MQGIVFTGPMVRAILDGRKTETRRLKPWKIGVYYVKETFAYEQTASGRDVVHYRADEHCLFTGRWKSARFMPEAASRLKIVVDRVCPEYLRQMSSRSLHSEGFATWFQFATIWDAMHKEATWEDNPLVWVHRFHVWTPGEANA